MCVVQKGERCMGMYLKEISRVEIDGMEAQYLKYESWPENVTSDATTAEPLTELLMEVFEDVPRQAWADVEEEREDPDIIVAVEMEWEMCLAGVQACHDSDGDCSGCSLHRVINPCFVASVGEANISDLQEEEEDVYILPIEAIGGMLKALSLSKKMYPDEIVALSPLTVRFKVYNLDTGNIVINYEKIWDDVDLTVEIDTIEYRAIKKALVALGLLAT